MKKKILWMLLLICSASFFSAAKQSGQCCKRPVSPDKTNQLEFSKTGNKEKADSGMGIDLSPLHFFLGAL